MADETRDPQDRNRPDEHLRRAEESGHEPLETSARGVTIAGLALLALIGITFGIMYGLFQLFLAPADEDRLEELVVERDVSRERPTRPGLDPDQPRTRRELRAHEDRFLKRYEWVDRDQGIGRIPIERAMELAARKDLLTGKPKDDGPKEKTEPKAKRPESKEGRKEK